MFILAKGAFYRLTRDGNSPRPAHPQRMGNGWKGLVHSLALVPTEFAVLGRLRRVAIGLRDVLAALFYLSQFTAQSAPREAGPPAALIGLRLRPH